MAERVIADIGSARDKQDRFTAKFQCHYLQWDLPQVTLEWAASRLVEENANPAVRSLKLNPEQASQPLVFPELEDRCYDLAIINKTGWVVHAPPRAEVLHHMHTSGVRVHAVLGGVKLGSLRPGALLFLPDAEDGLVLTAFEAQASLLVYAFPM